ncbi:MAG: hypothetical protein KGI06_06170, partial [Candidatus Micrarchaeota archaeon]|nr:hypothetical protein [Candidatus Micrarchaeota archaeon]
TVGNWQNVSTMTGWFAVPTGLSTVDSGVGTFQIASVTNSTTFVFNYTTNTGSCASSCGTTYSADYWGPYFAAQNAPALAGHGQAYWRFAWASDCANTTTFTTKYGSITGTPKYFIFNGAQNDLNNGDSAATLEGYLQACWQNAHNAGFTVIQSTIVPTGIGTPATTYQNVMEQVNYWLYTQGPNYTSVTATGTAAGKYWDKMINLDAFASNLGATGTAEGNSVGASYYFAERINDAFWKKMGSISGPPPYTFWSTNSQFPAIDYWGAPGSAIIYRWLQSSSQTPQLIIDTNAGTTTVVTPQGDGNTPLIVQNLNNAYPGGMTTKFTNLQAQSGSNFQLATGCNSIGLGTNNTNDNFGECFVNTGPNATTNEFFISPGYTTTNNILPPAGIALTAGGGVWFPSNHAVTGTSVGSQHLNVDTTGKLIVAASDSGIATLLAGTVTVSTPEACTPGAACSYQLTTCVLGGTQGMLSVGTVTAGTSFVVTSSSNTDTSQICWRIN